MHPQALNFYLDELSPLPPLDVLEFGSQNMNGSARDAYPHARSWFGIDTVRGPQVDRVADAATWRGDRLYDVVICAEVFEHTPNWREIVTNAHRHLVPGGLFLASCATEDRPPHSAVDGGELRDGEFYANVSHADMVEHLAGLGWESFEAAVADGHFGCDDLYVKAIR